ncbi:MAG: hypothetical protein L0191_01880, partial [Acidobacteria bacterium]|nr:hypothetical protein [Acidobacteriota bacterium]
MNVTHRLTVPASINVARSDRSQPVHAVMLDNSGEILDSILHYGTITQARRKLQAKLFEDLRELAADRANWQRRLIATVEGTLLLIEWRNG